MIAEALQAHYEARSKQESEEREKILGPSSLGDCPRKLAFLLSGMEPFPPSPESFRVFELGHQRGDALEEAAKAVWPDAVSQVPVEIPCGKHTIKGTADLWIPSLRTVVDFKTVGSYGAGLLDKEGPNMDYQLQLHAYRHGVFLSDMDPIPRGHVASHVEDIKCVLVYEAKDSDARKGVKAGQLIECEVPWSEELENAYRKRLLLLEKMLDEKEAGRLDPSVYEGYPKSHWKCRCDKDGKPLYCSIGPGRGKCHG